MKYALQLVIRGLITLGILVAIEWNFLLVSSLSMKIATIAFQWMVILIVLFITDIILMKYESKE